MKTNIPALLFLSLLAAVCFTGCQKTDTTPPVPAIAPAAPPTAAQNDAPPVTPPDNAAPTPLKDALNTLFTKEAEDANSPFPKGTHLLSVDLKDKTASVDVSKEFNALANKGESIEGLAQKKLCAALAEFPNVETLHLTVEGKDYESQAADWRSIPVRSDRDASSPAAAQQTDGLQKGSRMQPAGSVDR